MFNSSKKLILASLFVASTISFKSMANTSICSNALQRICTETTVLRSQRDMLVDKMKKEIAVEAERNAAPRIEAMRAKVSAIHLIKRKVQAFKIQNQEIMKSAIKRVGGLEKVVTSQSNVARLKTYMYEAIDKTNFPKPTKNQFKGIISSITIGNFADYVERTGLNDDVLAQFLGSACGTDGLVDNAFATTLEGKKYVLICPGFLITLNQKATDQERFDSILQAISHEMGHHLDNSKVGNALYRPFLSCMTTNYANKLNRSKDDTKFCAKQAQDLNECNLKVVLSHSGELIADQWGIMVTGIHADKMKYSVSDSENMLVNSWVKLCDSTDEGTHPTGNFRIGTMMRNNPDIIETLSCAGGSSLANVPTCTFNGAIDN